MKRIWLAAGTGILLPVQVVEAVSLRNNRPIIKHTLAKGEAVQGSIELVNDGDEPADVTAYLGDWQYSTAGDGTKEFGPPGTMGRSCSSWVSFFPQELSIPARGKAVVDYTIRVPPDGEWDGSYSSVLFFESAIGEVPDLERVGAVVRFAARIGSLLDIQVKGTVRQEGRLAIASIAPPTASSPLRLQGTLANEGNTSLQCENSFYLVGPHELVVARGVLPKAYLSAGQSVALTGDWNGALSPGAYAVVVTADCGEELVLVEEAPLTVP